MPINKTGAPGIPLGRRKIDRFTNLVSPCGSDGAESTTYSPAGPVTGAQIRQDRRPSQSESARNARRGEG